MPVRKGLRGSKVGGLPGFHVTFYVQATWAWLAHLVCYAKKWAYEGFQQGPWGYGDKGAGDGKEYVVWRCSKPLLFGALIALVASTFVIILMGSIKIFLIGSNILMIKITHWILITLARKLSLIYG
jgi:hypothetical protein